MRCRTGAFRTVHERLPSSLLQYAETDHAQRGRDADDLRHTELEFLKQDEAEDADAEKISAEVSDGVLKIEIPKVAKEEKKEDVKQIEVK